jgi:Flp pilus assembly protein TadD
MWSDLGDALAKVGRLEEALAAHRRSTELDPENSRWWTNRAQVATELGLVGEARDAAARAADLKPIAPS